MADVTQTPANVELVSSTNTSRYEAGEAIAAGQVVYVTASAGVSKAFLCNCDNDAKSDIKGMAINGASTGSQVQIVEAKGAIIDVGGTVTQGVEYVASDTDGNIMPSSDLTSGQNYILVGVGNDDGSGTQIVSNFHYTEVAHP